MAPLNRAPYLAGTETAWKNRREEQDGRSHRCSSKAATGEVLLLTFHSLWYQRSFSVMETQLTQDCGDLVVRRDGQRLGERQY